MNAEITQSLPSYACDAECAARIAEHIRALVDAAPPLSLRAKRLLRPDGVIDQSMDTAA